MSHKLWLAKGNTLTNITPIIGNLSWRSNIKELGTELNFNLASNDARYIPKNPCDIGDMVILKSDNFEITRCILVSEDRKGRDPIAYKAFDMAFYLNKSKRVYQFNKVSATQAITRICQENNIPINQIPNMPTKIDKIYTDDTLADIIKDIINQVEQDQGTKYIFEMRLGKFNVYKAVDMTITPTIKLASNIAPNSVLDAIGNSTRTRSIEDMRNRIQLVSDGKLITTLSNQSLIDQYGLLSEIVDIDEEDISKARNIAKNTLNELGKVFETTSIETLGNDLVMAGRLIEVEEPITGMKGKYMIESVQHNVSNGIHRMKLDLKGVG